MRSMNRSLDGRPGAMLTLIESNNESQWMPINGMESKAVSCADGVRAFMKARRKDAKYIRQSVRNAGWLLGMESIVFMSTHSDEPELAGDIILAINDFDSEGRTGLLDDIYDYCKQNNVPPSWAVASVMNIHDNQPVEHKFVINPKGIKL